MSEASNAEASSRCGPLQLHSGKLRFRWRESRNGVVEMTISHEAPWANRRQSTVIIRGVGHDLFGHSLTHPVQPGNEWIHRHVNPKSAAASTSAIIGPTGAHCRDELPPAQNTNSRWLQIAVEALLHACKFIGQRHFRIGVVILM